MADNCFVLILSRRPAAGRAATTLPHRLDVTIVVPSSKAFGMTKAFSFLMILAMVVQIVRPLGLPGLRKRADAWKLAVAALATIMIVAMTKAE